MPQNNILRPQFLHDKFNIVSLDTIQNTDGSPNTPTSDNLTTTKTTEQKKNSVAKSDESSALKGILVTYILHIEQ